MLCFCRFWMGLFRLRSGWGGCVSALRCVCVGVCVGVYVCVWEGLTFLGVCAWFDFCGRVRVF